jgi:hypothetical protein
MFTLKLYADAASVTEIIECRAITVNRSHDGTRLEVVHADGGNQSLYIGPSRVASDLGEPIYDKAIVENAAGKTTEIIVPRPSKFGSQVDPATGLNPVLPPGEALRQHKATDTGKTLQEWRDLLKETEGHGGAAAGRTS